jgi:hypothetical protein
MAGPLHIALCETAPSSYGTLQDARPLARGQEKVKLSRPDRTEAKFFVTITGSPYRGMEGAVTQCAMYAGLSVDFVKDLPAAGELVERLWQECMAVHDTTAGTAHRFRERSKGGRIRR